MTIALERTYEEGGSDVETLGYELIGSLGDRRESSETVRVVCRAIGSSEKRGTVRPLLESKGSEDALGAGERAILTEYSVSADASAARMKSISRAGIRRGEIGTFSPFSPPSVSWRISFPDDSKLKPPEG